MKIVKQLFIFTLTIFSASQITAAPVINNITGEFTDGQSITIAGEKFGTASAIPFVWDNPDELFKSTLATDQQAVPSGEGYIWGKNAASQWATDVVFSKSNTRPGRLTSYSGGKRSNLSWPNSLKNENLRNIYVTWWFKPNMDPNENGKGSGHKFMRIWDNPNGKETRVSWGAALLHGSGTEVKWSGWGGKVGEWNRMEIWVSADDGIIKTWVNNNPIYDVTGFKKVSSTHGLKPYLLGWDPSDSSIYPNFKFNMSDIYISSTLARVEISNSSTWDKLDSEREVQPITSWSDGRISFTLNSKTLGDMNSNKYLYVVDSNGVANMKGYPLCSACPQPPEISIE